MTRFGAIIQRPSASSSHRHSESAEDGASNEVSGKVQSVSDDHRYRPQRRSVHGLTAMTIAAPRSNPFTNPAVATVHDNIVWSSHVSLLQFAPRTPTLCKWQSASRFQAYSNCLIFRAEGDMI